MKILVFSDTHLTPRFEEKKFKFLESIIKKAEQVIINGDFWEGYTCSFQQFIASPWKHLFPLLKKKKAVYILGNHDKKIFLGKKTQLFSSSITSSIVLKQKNLPLTIEHGNRFSPSWDDEIGLKKPPALAIKAFEMFERTVVRSWGKKGLLAFFGRFNKKIKKQIQKTDLQNTIHLLGHTHCAEIDLKNRFVNSGIIRHGLGQYITIEHGTITQHEEWYDP